MVITFQHQESGAKGIYMVRLFLFAAILNQIHQDTRHLRRKQLARNAGNPRGHRGRNSRCSLVCREIWI